MGPDKGLDLPGGILENPVGASSKAVNALKDVTHHKHSIELPEGNVSVVENLAG